MPSVLSTGTSALLAFQRALATTSHNVANINTDGYSRQKVDFATRSPTDAGYATVGNGTKITDIRRVADQLAISRLLDSNGELARLQQLSAMADRVDSLFSDSATNLSGVWSNFFDSISGLSANAAGSADRRSVLDSANTLVNRFKSMSANLESLGSEVNNGLMAAADEVNRLAAEIAQINGVIGSNVAKAAPDLLDRRDQLITQLVGYTGGTAVIQDGGIINVYSAGGNALVVGTSASKVTTVADPYQPERLQLALVTQGQTITLDGKALGGSIGGLLEFRDTILAPAQAELGRIAVGMALEFNQSHREGMDLYGDMGVDFFNLAPPKVSAHSGNDPGSTASISASYDDLAALDGQNLQLRFDGSNWIATRTDTGVQVPMTGTGPTYVVNGIELTISGTPSLNDRFLLQPTATATNGLSVAITDPSRIAAANPVRASADLGNIGTGVAGKVDVTDATDTALLNQASIEFIDADNYTIDGAGPFPYVPGQVISANGWSLVLDGKPAAGDQFIVAPNQAGSSDNGNATRLAAVEDAKSFNGGTITLNGALGGLTTQVGAAARAADYSLQAQQVINENAQATRDAISGVNLDEEAADMLRLQQAYQAASQLISTADTLFQSILRAVG
ncbi:flagellar hook-associated protein FlgK [Stenotrophomonas sp. NLF4-10]|uniref:flagellar hook-associated protein FlgK n=1 Tax=Stenotrophomonas sp. NLF4-10 TaxID=2918754 RepID=UPI001EFAE87A|nr:flagellar hook-associated protein FlgK [Stenotrophomonas sp. NLF4-10]MCG8276463.1 flagellar hook-associated protein FlgK [Stenotrophomonas sp. NLF4-10]